MYKERLDVGAKSQFTSPFHQSDLVICSFVLLFVGFCLCFIRQLISPVSLKQESIRFRPAFMLRVSPPHSAMWLISTMNLGPVPTAVPVYPHDAADINTNTDVHVNTVTRVMLFSNELQYLQYGRAESQNPQSRPEIDFLCSCLVFTNKQTNAFLLVGFLVFRGCVCGCVGVFLSLIQSVLCSVWWRVLVISSSDCCVTQISAHSCFGRSFSYVDIVCY